MEAQKNVYDLTVLISSSQAHKRRLDALPLKLWGEMKRAQHSQPSPDTARLKRMS